MSLGDFGFSTVLDIAKTGPETYRAVTPGRLSIHFLRPLERR